MEKILRSLIHEKFDLNTRVEIELLSRRRDIHNKEKQEEIIKLLRKKEVGEVVQLGSGTNRYAIKLDGYVIKFATDHDGKIDNLKEFKMAKRLYPYVTKTYEVTESGSMLVAEYVQPFDSYWDMEKYTGKIREILKKLSSTYLIGDVGITSKNFSNWGLRVGTEDPVCLDFAYVYEVSSNLFMCRYCSVGAMLVPNEDFTELHCTNKACGRRYTFEDIRSMIGNDIHAHEIGDLSEEGYRLSESGILTSLTESRSNYLIKKREEEEAKEKAKHKVVKETFVDNFVMDKAPTKLYMEESKMTSIERIMNNVQNNGIPRIPVTAIPITTPQSPAGDVTTINPQKIEVLPLDELKQERTLAEQIKATEDSGKKLMATKYGVTQEEYEQALADLGVSTPDVEEDEVPEGSVAFSMQMNDDINIMTALEVDKMDKNGVILSTSVVRENIEEKKEERKIPVVSAQVITPSSSTVETKVEEKNEEPIEETVVEEVVENKPYEFNRGFINKMKEAVSKVTNRMKDQLYAMELYDPIKSARGIRDKKMYPEQFYKGIQNAAFRTLVMFCGFTERDQPRNDGRGTYKAFIPPSDLHGDYEPTLRFFERIWNDKVTMSIWNEEDFLTKYREFYSDFQGIQPGWRDMFEKRLANKMPIDRQSAKKIADVVCEMWCTPIVQVEEPSVVEEIKEEVWTEDELNKYAQEVWRLKGIPPIKKPLTTEDYIKIASSVMNMKYRSMFGQNIEISDIEDVDLAELSATVDDLKFDCYYNFDFTRKHSGILICCDYLENKGICVDAKLYSNMDELIMGILAFDLDNFKQKCVEEVQKICQQIAQSSEDSDDEQYEMSDMNVPSDEDEPVYLSVNIQYLDDFDIVKITSEESFGEVTIPIYTKLDEVKEDEVSPSMVDDRNGIWDWLIHMVPDLMFTTKDPDKYLKINIDELYENQPHIVILDHDTDGNYIMGIFYLAGVYIYDEEDDDAIPCFNEALMKKINKLVKDNIGYSQISHLRRSLTMTELITTDVYVDKNLPALQDTEDDDDSDGVDPSQLSEQEQAALLALILSGSGSLPEDATDEMKAAADLLRERSYNAMKVPVPEKIVHSDDKEKDRNDDIEIVEAEKVEPPNPGMIDVIRRPRSRDR